MSPPSSLSTSFFHFFLHPPTEAPQHIRSEVSIFFKPSRLLKRAVQTPRVEEPTRLKRSISVRLERYCVNTKRA